MYSERIHDMRCLPVLTAAKILYLKRQMITDNTVSALDPTCAVPHI